MSKRKIESPEQMEQLWNDYKKSCESVPVRVTEFSAKEGRFITDTVYKTITCTIEGFCVYIGMGRSRFYETYANDESYRDIVTRMRGESEQDVRSKFETGRIPTQLSGLWMSKFDYGIKQQTDINATVTEADKALLDKVSKRLEQGKNQGNS